MLSTQTNTVQCYSNVMVDILKALKHDTLDQYCVAKIKEPGKNVLIMLFGKGFSNLHGNQTSSSNRRIDYLIAVCDRI